MIKVLAMSFLGAILANFLSTAAFSQQIDPDIGNGELARLEREKLQKHWNISANISFVEGEHIESIEQGKLIRIGKNGLDKLLKKVEKKNRKFVFKWLLAHEYWHQVQFRQLGSKAKSNNSQSQLRECQADVMATHYLIDSEFNEPSFALTANSGKEIADAIREVLEGLRVFESSGNQDGSHPSLSKRWRAISFGYGRAIIDSWIKLEEKTSNSAELQLSQSVKRVLSRNISIISTEHIQDWSYRICENITHTGDGVPALSVINADRKIKWNTSNKNQTVDLNIPFSNTSGKPISISAQIATVSADRAGPNDVSKWQYLDSRYHKLILQPGETKSVELSLIWDREAEDRVPRLLVPMNADALYNAKIYNPHLSANQRLRRNLPVRLKKLASVILLVAGDVANNFSSVTSDSCNGLGIGKACQLKIEVPGILSPLRFKGHISHDRDQTEIVLPIYRGISEKIAFNRLKSWINDLKAIFPNREWNEELASDGTPTLSISPNAGTDLFIGINRQSTDLENSDTGEIVVLEEFSVNLWIEKKK